MSGRKRVLSKARKASQILVPLVLAATVVFSIGFAGLSSVSANPAQSLIVNFTAKIASGGNFRALSLQTGDEVVQFTRTNVILATAASGGFHTVGTAAGTASGDLTATYSVQFNSIDLPVAVASGYDGFGFNIGKGEINCGSGNSFKFVVVADYDYAIRAPSVIHSVTAGYVVSVQESGQFSGQKLIGRFSSQTSDEDANPGEETIRGTMTLTRYFANEVSFLGETTFDATALPGRMQSIPTLTADGLVSFTHANFVLPANDATNFEEVDGGTTITITGGPLTGTMTNERNVVTYFSYPTCMGWAAGKFSIVDGIDTITGLMVNDVEDIGTEQHGYMFALAAGTTTGKYAGKEYFGFTRSTITPGTYHFSGSMDVYELQARSTLHSVTVYARDAAAGRTIAGAQIFLDGVLKGTTNILGSLTITGVTPGTHTASASKTGYAPSTPIQFSVSRSTTVAIVLTPQVVANTLTVQLCILGSSTPIANVMVYLDGRYVGKTNAQGQVIMRGAASGIHTFSVVASGYITKTQAQTLAGPGPWTLTIYLAHR